MKNNLINNEKIYLGKRGYILKKEYFNSEQLEKIKKELTVKPNVPNTFNENVKTFKVYLENKNKMYIPKFYGIKNFGIPDINKIPDGDDINIEFAFSLRDEQKAPCNIAIEKYNSTGGGILDLQCGFGKTILACYLISKMKKKTLVIVHKTFLLNQWVERINQSLPTAKIGIIQGDKFDIKDADIVIGMLQTIWNKDFPLNAFDSFGHVIIDECHTISSEKFSRALFKINSKYMLGLSATPNRQDGLTKVLKWHIGDIIFSKSTINLNTVNVERIIINSNNQEYKKELVDYRGRTKQATMINNISECKNRIYAIIKFAIETLKEHPERQILILGDRKKQLNDIYNLVTENNYCSVGYYIGGMSEPALKESEKKQLILGTYAMASTGLDIKSLNCLVLATPRSDIIQSIGRILRQEHNNLNPKIIDIVDTFSVFNNQSKKRFNVYKKRKYLVEDISIDIDDFKIISRKEYNFLEKSCDKTNFLEKSCDKTNFLEKSCDKNNNNNFLEKSCWGGEEGGEEDGKKGNRKIPNLCFSKPL
jgi:superfamily II DNA or RNA helicase